MKITQDMINTIIGVDQTGAKKGKASVKELPITVIRKKCENSWEICQRDTKLNNLNIKNLVEISSPQKTLICIDSVLGLPKEYEKGKRSINHYIKETTKHEGYGQKVAELFFDSIQIEDKTIRSVEKKLNANSVFTSRPYQKNIQTGTYRVWKDLSEEIDSFNIWPNKENFKSNQYTLIEGFPTYAWKYLNNSQRFSKDLSVLYSKFIEVKNIELISKQGPDHQDASLLALICFHRLRSGISFKEVSIEGDILL